MMNYIAAPSYLIDQFIMEKSFVQSESPDIFYYSNCSEQLDFGWQIMGRMHTPFKRLLINRELDDPTICRVFVSTVWPNLDQIEWILGISVVQNMCLSLNYEDNSIGIGLPVVARYQD